MTECESHKSLARVFSIRLNYDFDPIIEIDSITMAGYYPGSKSIWIKIIADRPYFHHIEHSLAIQMDIHSDLHLPLVTTTSLKSKRKL